MTFYISGIFETDFISRPVLVTFNGSQWSNELSWRNNLELNIDFDKSGKFDHLTVFGDKLYAAANVVDGGSIISSELIMEWHPI